MTRVGIIVLVALGLILPSAGFHTVEETPRGWAFKAADGRLWRARGIEKANGYGPLCGSLGRPYAEALSRAGLTRESWCAQTAARLREWGFNMLGTGCDGQINQQKNFSTTEMIALSSWMRDRGADHLIAVDPSSPCTPLANVFHPDFPAVCDEAAKASCISRRDDPQFLGYYLDNELNWWGCGNWWECGLLDAALEKLPAGHPARTAAEKLVAKIPSSRVPDRAAARRLYTEAVAHRYFKTITAAIRRYDPNHLILGCRFAGVAGGPDCVWRICGKYCDVVSLNCYPNADLAKSRLMLGVCEQLLPKGFVRTEEWTPVPLEVMLSRRYEVAKKPLLIGEWSFRGGDIGRPRRESNGQELATQAERAEAIALFLEAMERLPYVVGHAYYMWCDERFPLADGAGVETLNWGLVSMENLPHEAATAAFRMSRPAFGFYRVENSAVSGWQLVDPSGRSGKMLAIEKANMRGPRCEAHGNYPYLANLEQRRVTREAWCQRTAARLRDWGFNALGTSCDELLRREGLAHTEMLAFGARLTKIGGDDTLYIRPWQGRCCEQFPNVFHPRFAEVCEEVASRAAKRLKHDRTLVGYYLDNELNWWGEGDWYYCGMLDYVLKHLKAGHSAYDEAIKVIERHSFSTAQEYLAKPEKERDPIRREYTRMLAERYFSIATSAIRRHDPNHLILGCRFAGMQGAPDEVWKIAGKYCDIVSFNCYPTYVTNSAELTVSVHYRSLGARDGRFSPKKLEGELLRLYALAKKPFLVSEWSFIGLDAGLPCKRGCGQRLATQSQRAQAVEAFVDFVATSPCMVGSSFFKWTDDPPQGVTLADPEDSNYGLVDIADKPYAEVTEAFRRAKKKRGN